MPVHLNFHFVQVFYMKGGRGGHYRGLVNISFDMSLSTCNCQHFFYSPTNAQVIVLKTILKFTLKQLRHVSVQSHQLQGAHYLYLLKLHFVKTVNCGTLVYD